MPPIFRAKRAMLGQLEANVFCRIGILILAGLTALPAMADTQFRVRRMMRNDVPAGKGQCDIRLQVDQEAEVSVRGEMVSIRTIAGRDPRDDGSECNAPFPGVEVQGFNFEVKDSRGEIRLVGEPSRRNGYAAVVWIRDSAGGEGRYHFRLSWFLGGAPVPAPPVAPPPRDYPPERRGFVWNDIMTFRGEGRGTVSWGGAPPLRLFGVNVDVDRQGRIQVVFRMEGGRTLAFSGMVVDEDRGRLRADVTTDDRFRMRGPMWLTVERHREVNNVTIEADNGRDRLRLTWDRTWDRR
jgi:hypothetical protein